MNKALLALGLALLWITLIFPLSFVVALFFISGSGCDFCTSWFGCAGSGLGFGEGGGGGGGSTGSGCGEVVPTSSE